MKHMKKIILFFVLIVVYAYVCAILNMPNRVILIQGESLNLKTLLGISVTGQPNEFGAETLSVSSTMGNTVAKESGNYHLKVKLFDTIQLKDISVDVLDAVSVVPVGRAIGMKLYTEGILVVGKSEVAGKVSYEEADIEEGDCITKINNEPVECTEELMEKVNQSNGEKLRVTYKRENLEKETTLLPIQTENHQYKIGLWVRDAAAGIGTLSFYEPESRTCIALGHGIMDIDTQELIQIAKGNMITTKILSIKKGKKGEPGEMKGTIENGNDIGNVFQNTEFGVVGKISNKSVLGLSDEEKVPVALRNEIQEGKAEILAQVEEGRGSKRYEIEIKRIYRNNNENNKSFLIKVTDKELLEKTGGIIQGMSGSPILQNGKLIGVVTNVLVNDPTSGYGVFADLMIKKMKEVENS